MRFILYGFLWCRRRDLNPHGFLHTPLKRARIPIPPLRHIFLFNFQSLFCLRGGAIASLLPSPRKIINLSRRQSATTTHLLASVEFAVANSYVAIVRFQLVAQRNSFGNLGIRFLFNFQSLFARLSSARIFNAVRFRNNPPSSSLAVSLLTHHGF